ncbi:hypothetical protein ACJX0J_021738, partial [Zea mays]
PRLEKTGQASDMGAPPPFFGQAAQKKKTGLKQLPLVFALHNMKRVNDAKL